MGMGGGAGHMLDMVIRMRNNRKMRTKRNSYFKMRKEFHKVNYQPTVLRDAPPEVLAAIRHKLKKQRKRELIRNGFAMVVSIGITLFLCYLLSIYFIPFMEFDVIFRNGAAGIPPSTH